MRYGYFDNANREYVIDRVDVPVSWTNYIGLKDMYGVFNHTAGGYLLYKTPEYHRITRFRPNGVPMDGPGHYVYLRDNETGDYWSVSWQPVGKPKEHYSCRHGLSYSKYHCDYSGIDAEQTLFVAMDDPVEIWNVTLRNDTDKVRNLSVFSYLEFSFHQIDMDNRNFQMSLYAAGSRYENGIIEHDLYYEEDGYQFFTSNFQPDGFDCLRDRFIGPYRTERNPLEVELGQCSGSFEKGGNHCGCLKKNILLRPGEQVRLIYLLGEGGIAAGEASGFTGHKEAATPDIYFRVVTDETTRVAGVQTGEYDITEGISLEQYEALTTDSSVVLYTKTGGTLNLFFNTTKGIMAKEEMRDAIMACLNCDNIMMASYINPGLYSLNQGWMNPASATWGSKNSEHYNQNNVEKAKQLLTAAGYNNEEILLVTTPDYPAMYNATLVVHAQLVAAGINAKVEQYEDTAHFARTFKKMEGMSANEYRNSL